MRIQLTKGYFTEVDDCDNDLAELNWCAVENKTRYQVYARRKLAGNKQISLHRTILERILGRSLERKELVDHIDGNSLNNHRNNLRVVDHRHNMKNIHGRRHGAMKSKQLSLMS